MLPFKILTQDDFTAITLDEAKSQCRLMPSFVLDDTYIASLITVAVDAAQEYVHWMLSPGTVKQFSDVGGDIMLYGKYVTGITEVTGRTGLSGDDVVLTTDDYEYNDVTDVVSVNPAYSFVNVTYACGATALELPKAVKQGILMLISTMYNNREDFITGLTVEKMPLTSKKLLGLSRIYVS